jgi:hypothetical protein
VRRWIVPAVIGGRELKRRERRAPCSSGCGGRRRNLRGEPFDFRLQAAHVFERAFGTVAM